MNYDEFIGELRELIRQGNAMVEDGVASHEHPAFRAWRHTAQSLVANVRAQGYALPGSFKSHERTYRAPWVHAGRVDDGDRFRRDMNDSLIELEYLVEQFDRYGEPGPAQSLVKQAGSVAQPRVSKQATATTNPHAGISSEKITLAWMRDHIPFSFWVAAIALLATVFAAGFLAGQNDFFQKTYHLIQETRDGKSE
jgi:hypothetical protein